MRLVHRLLLATLMAVIALNAQAQQNPLHAYLPANAKAIINLNLPSLATKLSWQEVQQLSFFEDALKDAPLPVQEILKDPTRTGINFKSDFFIVVLPDPNNKTKTTGYFYGLVADTAKFARTVQQIAPKQKIKTLGKMKLLADDKNIVAWTSEMFVMPMSKNQSFSKTNKKVTDPKAAALQSKQLLSKYQLMLTPVANPVTTDSRFVELTKENGDMRLWINRNVDVPKEKGKKTDEIFKMMNWGMMQQGNYMAGVLRFENGKAVMQMKSYMNKTMDSLYRLYPAASLNSNLLKKFPSGQPIALLSFSLSPEMLGALMKTMGAEKIIDSLTKKSAIKPLDIIDGLNGDLTLAVIRAHEFDEKDTVTAALNGLQIFLAASVKNKAKVEPLLGFLNKPKEAKTDEEGNVKKPAGPFGSMKPAWLLNDSFFVVSISSFAAEKFLASAGDNEVAQLAAPYTSHASLFSLDLKAIIGFAMQMSKKKRDSDQEAAKMFESFDKIVLYGGKYENGAALSTGELQFTDKGENSLKQFMKLIEMGAALGMQSKKASKAYDYDSGDTPPPAHEKLDETKIEVVEDVELPPPPPPKPKSKPKTQKGNK